MHRDISQALANWIALKDQGEFILHALMHVSKGDEEVFCLAGPKSKTRCQKKLDRGYFWLMLLIFCQLFCCCVTTCETATASCGLRSLLPFCQASTMASGNFAFGVPELSATAMPCIITTGMVSYDGK